MNQRQVARRILAFLEPAAAGAALDKVVGAAQNGPPDGQADGSIDEVLWCQLRAARDAARAYGEAQSSASQRIGSIDDLDVHDQVRSILRELCPLERPVVFQLLPDRSYHDVATAVKQLVADGEICADGAWLSLP